MLDRAKVLEKAKEILLPMVSHGRREPGWVYRHGLRTANLSLWLRQRIFPNNIEMDDILYAAGLFHDCAKDDDENHAVAGAARAGEYLRGIASGNELDSITEAISMHNNRGVPCRDLDKLLQDADIVDHFGTIEIWLNVSYSVLGGEGPERSLEFYSHEWDKMISDLRSLFNFDLSRAIFEDRIAYDEAFIKRLRIESDGGVANTEKFHI